MARILLIEDDIQLQKLLYRMLEREGHDVRQACNGEQGINWFHETPADLVITDIIMPEKTGLDVITELKRDYPDVKIIAMSGGARAGTKLLNMAQTLGAHKTLKKPFTRETLIAAIQEVLEG
jgi:DNA-binding NtrC family response regulator